MTTRFLTDGALGVSAPRWIAAATGLISLAGALAGAWGGDPVLGSCLRGDAAALATLGHCPLCYAAIAGFLAAALPSPADLRRVFVKGD